MTNQPGIRLGRRALSILYDTLPLMSVLAAGALIALPLNSGQAVEAGTLWFQLWLAALGYLYFVFSWVRGGQTLGMRAWKIRVVDKAGKPAGWGKLTLRLGAAVVSLAALGLGFWVSWRAPHLAWHDRWSGTRLVSAVPS